MREVKKEQNSFIDIKNGKPLMCAFDKNHFINNCIDECVACEINKEGTLTTVTCLRGSFTFASIVE